MLKIRYHKQFKKDFKLAMRRGLKADLLEEVLHFLIQEKELPVRYRDHQLTNSKHFQGVRECHIQPDWLLVYKVDKDELIFTIKAGKSTQRLLISASPSLPLLYLTQVNKPSPMTAPAFCMLLRKHIGSARILSITQLGLERVVCFHFEHLDELGDVCQKKLYVELMGKYSNIICI